jgi:hypothetical protein
MRPWVKLNTDALTLSLVKDLYTLGFAAARGFNTTKLNKLIQLKIEQPRAYHL